MNLLKCQILFYLYKTRINAMYCHNGISNAIDTMVKIRQKYIHSINTKCLMILNLSSCHYRRNAIRIPKVAPHNT